MQALPAFLPIFKDQKNRKLQVNNDPVNMVDVTGTTGIYFYLNPCIFMICESMTVSAGLGSTIGHNPNMFPGEFLPEEGGVDFGVGNGWQFRITMPKAKITKPGKELKPGCGRAEFEIEWGIENSGRGGWLIQHIIYERNVFNADGSKLEQTKSDYWEAWQVDANGKVQSPGTDTFSTKSFGDGTQGHLIVTGYAKYYEGYSLPSDFIVGGAGSYAGDLRSTLNMPSEWSDKGAYLHQLSVKFNCVDNGEITEIDTKH